MQADDHHSSLITEKVINNSAHIQYQGERQEVDVNVTRSLPGSPQKQESVSNPSRMQLDQIASKKMRRQKRMKDKKMI